MHVTCRSAAAVLKLGEEEPDGVTKTMRGRWRRAPLEVALWEPGTSVCKDGEEGRMQGPSGPRGGGGTIGRESVQRLRLAATSTSRKVHWKPVA